MIARCEYRLWMYGTVALYTLIAPGIIEFKFLVHLLYTLYTLGSRGSRILIYITSHVLPLFYIILCTWLLYRTVLYILIFCSCRESPIYPRVRESEMTR